MKKVVLLATLSLLATAAFAMSWSGLLEENFKVSTSESEKIAIDQSNGIYLSFKAPINADMRITGEGLYKYNLHATEDQNTFSNIVDIDLLKFNGIWKNGTSNIVLDAGRFSISDLSGAFFTQCSDGLNLKYETAKWNVLFYAGYTGLLNSLNVSMVDKVETNDDFYGLSAAYIPVMLNYTSTSFLGSNVLGIQGSYFKGITDGLTDKLYATVGLNGNIKTSASYSTAVVAGLNDYKDFMLYAKADITSYLTKNALMTFGLEYASGEHGPLKSFIPITAKNVSCTGISQSGVLVPQVSAMYVAEKLFACINEKFVLSIPESAVETFGLDSSLSVLYNVFSDVQIGCDVIAFLGKNSSDNKLSVTAKATLAF